MGLVAYSTKEVKLAEKQIIESGVSEEELINRASDKIAQFLLSQTQGEIAFLCGGGNNGSDALSSAIKLGKNVKVYASEKCNSINASLRKEVEKITTILPLCEFDGKCEIIVDGLCGTGLSRSVDGEYKEVIRKANESRAIRIAIDIPTGLDDRGIAVGDTVFKADYTLALGAIKYADILFDAVDFCGQVVYCDIGLSFNTAGVNLIDEQDVILQKRKSNTHKGSYGKIKIVGGSLSFVGAPCFSAMSAIRSGAGLTSLCVPYSLKSAYLDNNALYGYTFEYMPDIDGQHDFDPKCAQRITQNASVIAIGMGMGNTESTANYLKYFAQNFDGTLIIDADGINAISQIPDFFKTEIKAKIILTPHIGEFLKLNPSWDKSVDGVVEYAKQNGVSIVVKSAVSILTDGKNIAINTSGCPALAKGGSGDILAGILSSMSVIYEPLDALKRACYYLGKSGEYACQTKSEISLNPTDIIESLPFVFKTE